jgi:serine protease Do
MRIAIYATVLICGFVLPGRGQQSVPVAQHAPQDHPVVCGWMGVQVGPMTVAFAESLGMVEPYGAIFERPEPGSPAANAGIEAGDVITAVNGSPLKRSSDFAEIISMMAPGSVVYLSTWRNGELIEVRLTLGSFKCPKERHGAAVIVARSS